MKRIFLVLVIALPWVLMAQPNPTIQAFKAEKLFVKGRTLFETGDYTAAIDMFNQVVELDENHTMVFEMRGDAFYELGRYREALADYRDASRIHPENAELRNNMGVVAAQLGMYAAASSYFNEALEINPEHETARENLTKAQRRAQDDPAFNGRLATNTRNKEQERQKFRDQLKGKSNRNSPISNRNPKSNTTTNSRKNSKTQKAPSRFPHSYLKRDREIQVGQQSDPFFNIVKVQVSKSTTRITFELESSGDEPFTVKLDGKNSPNSFYITDRAMSRTFKLLKITGLRGWPNEPYVLHPEDPPLIVVAEFERIAEDMYIFHLLEGRQEREGTWDFWDVKLTD
ncbi:MAG: tetratricopeptide repeat protein [Bacteroidota bacterium]